MMQHKIKTYLQAHLGIIQAIIDDEKLINQIQNCVEVIVHAYKNSNKVLLCGNGGSAADAAHLAGELSGRYFLDRPALHAEALHVNGAALTAVANDYGYDNAYARILESKGNSGDIIILLSTSGKSSNVIKTKEKAQSLAIETISITGQSAHQSLKSSDIHIEIPSTITPHIQEATMIIGHMICEHVEATLYGNKI